MFPIPLALSCSWDMDAIARSAQIAAREATADGINWTFSPMVDICHDGRWGRISEGSGEDPYLGSLVAKGVRPYKELRGFERVTLDAGESREVVFALDADRMGYFEPYHLKWTLEPGEMSVMVGPNVRETQSLPLHIVP